MDLICVICGHEPQEGESFIALEKWLKCVGSSRQNGETVMICSRHMGSDVINAFRNGGYAYREHINAEVAC
ncbi:hypothetical protein LCGC14_3028060 [marine sediment metagenome]|uniref:Uncharacterized protein n=1 Tax=marine sediment metagenome TaxID=412755 RepID=A0A0F8Z0Y8_9ZZZZ